jgi:ATP:cob(I)alamin adenosyltransferase
VGAVLADALPSLRILEARRGDSDDEEELDRKPRITMHMPCASHNVLNELGPRPTKSVSVGFTTSLAVPSRTRAGYETTVASSEDIQRRLLGVGSVLTTPNKEQAAMLGFEPARWTPSLEASIGEMDAKLPPLAAFILPGGGRCCAYVHVCRSVCRRAERADIAVREKENFCRDKTLHCYLTRREPFERLFLCPRPIREHRSGKIRTR